MPDHEAADPERGKQSLQAAHSAAARDADLRDSADTVVNQIRALRAENHWRDRVAALFQAPRG